MKINILTMALFLTIIQSCQNTVEKNPTPTPLEQSTKEAPPTKSGGGTNTKNPALFGAWKGQEWLLDGKTSGADASIVNFTFNEDGTFKANYGNQHRSGTWRTMNDSLYTQEPGKKEIPMKLLIANGTALDFEMNLKGRSEVLKFKKQ